METFDLLLLNSKPYINNYLKKFVCKMGIKKIKKVLKNEADVVETDIDKFFEIYVNKISFGVIIVNNVLLDIEKSKRYIGTYHLYSGAIFDSLDKSQKLQGKIKVLITSYPYIIWGRGNKSYENIKSEVCAGIGKWYGLVPHRFRVLAKKNVTRIVESNDYGDFSNLIWQSYIEAKKIYD